ncbi:gliding motility lipoprotein GldB [Gynurincola endophyticus]|uniref:gliding motility lipoprotein GldB n=1 Tax=Gynurincola endophyticus TaxID=2479004 RepID=UPI000F8ED65B|nr:hypothetical protein [Gynurincola endophyticus]
MRKILFASLIFLYACGGNKAPDVSHIEAPLTVQRFDQDFFQLDTLQLTQQLEVLRQKYPDFLGDYLFGILGINNRLSEQEMFQLIKKFITDYHPVYQDAQAKFKDMSSYQKDIQQGLKYVKYYFPDYTLPEQLFTFIGPMDAFFEAGTSIYGDIITQSGLGVGLQLHLGADYHMYHSEMGLLLYPTYLSRRYTPDYIPVNALKNIADDIYPGQNNKNNLVAQMVEKGKKLYLLDLFLPHTSDTLKLGYTESQLNGCIKNEGLIWNFFIKNDLLYNQDVNRLRGYLNEGPNTPELGDGSPGYIGLFVGRQIVRAYMAKFPDTKLEDLLKKDPEDLFMESKYKPK